VEQAFFRPAVKLLKKWLLAAEVKLWADTNLQNSDINKRLFPYQQAKRLPSGSRLPYPKKP